MDLSVIDKINLIFQYMFSSPIAIGLLVLSFILSIVLFVTLKKNNKIIQIIAVSIYFGFVIGIFITYTSYVKLSINSFVKGVLNYIYFPSTIVYFFIMLFVTILVVYTIFSKRLSPSKKFINYCFFSILFYFFLSFMTLAAKEGVDLVDISKLYRNDTILSIVQISNFILLIWLLFTCFYHLYCFFKNKYNE